MSSVTNKSVSKDEDEIDLGRLLGELIDHRKIIISITAFLQYLLLSMRCLAHLYTKRML